jgi:diaminopimelate decarboxylase
MRRIMMAKITDQDLDESFYICNLKSISDRIDLWNKILPRVEIFYASKCNPD